MAQERLIICNTSPLINLAEIGQLGLLETLFGGVFIPPAVARELEAKRDLFPNAARCQEDGKIGILGPIDVLLVRSLSVGLHPGEAECIGLAMERPGSLLILDDLSARTVATSHGIPFTGTLGILTAAKARGHIGMLAPLLGDLRVKARFWINQKLEMEILREADESRE